MNQSECWHCGDARHETTDYKSSTQGRLAISLEGATRGRRIGFKVAQSKAAEIALKMCKDSTEGLAIYNAIMDISDAT